MGDRPNIDLNIIGRNICGLTIFRLDMAYLKGTIFIKFYSDIFIGS